jgi:hypothetical protein
VSLADLNARHRKKRRANEIWFGDEEQPEERPRYQVDEDDLELMEVAKGDGTYVLMSPEAVARLTRRPTRDAMKPRDDLLGREEQAQISESIGVPVESWSEAKRVMWDRNLRFSEKGDTRDRVGRERREWIAGGKKGPNPLPNGSILGEPKPIKVRKLMKERGIG